MGNHRAQSTTRYRGLGSLRSQDGRGAGSAPCRHRGPRRFSASSKHLPVLPSLIGIAVLAVAGAGAATMPPTRASATTAASLAAASGTDGSGVARSSLRDRTLAISRDSERQAMQDAADQPLQGEVDAQAAERNAALKSLGQAAEQRAQQIAKNVWVLPTRGYHLTARFDDAGGLWSHRHTGLDFAAPTGTPIFAVANGTIVSTQSAGAYGNQTIERLNDGTEIWYCHQNAFGTRPGAVVTSGQTIGYVGSTGNTTGPHLHLEVRPGGGDPVDPFTALTYHGVTP